MVVLHALYLALLSVKTARVLFIHITQEYNNNKSNNNNDNNNYDTDTENNQNND